MSLLNVLHKQTRPGISTFLFSQIRECTNKGKLCQLTCCTTCTRPTHQILGTSPLTCHCSQGSCSPSLLGAELARGQCPCYHLLRQKHIKNSDNSFSPQKSQTLAEAICPLPPAEIPNPSRSHITTHLSYGQMVWKLSLSYQKQESLEHFPLLSSFLPLAAKHCTNIIW